MACGGDRSPGPAWSSRSQLGPVEHDEEVLLLPGERRRLYPNEGLGAEHLLELAAGLRIVPPSAAHLAVVTRQSRNLAIQDGADVHDRRDLLVGTRQSFERLLLAQVILAWRIRVAGAPALRRHESSK